MVVTQNRELITSNYKNTDLYLVICGPETEYKYVLIKVFMKAKLELFEKLHTNTASPSHLQP
jgi:hypothetical protein